jgi:flagellin
MLDIRTNNYSIVAQNNLNNAQGLLQKSIERLSSGLRINRAADDASGLAVAEKLRGQINGLTVANRNAQDAISFLQTAEGGMEVIGDMVQRMRELAVQAGNGTYTSSDRAELQKEVDQLKAEVNRISASTEYNTKKVLTGDAAALWSADSDKIQAVVRGAPAEGNYKLDFQVEGGQEAIYKSDVMGLNEAQMIAADGLEVAGLEAMSSKNDTAFFNGATVTTALAAASAGATMTDAAPVAQFTSAGSAMALDAAELVASATTTTNSGYLMLESMGNGVTASGAATVTVKATYTAADGTKTTATYELMTTGTATAKAVNFASANRTLKLANGEQITFQIGASADIGTIEMGDKFLYEITGAKVATATNTVALSNLPTSAGPTGTSMTFNLDEKTGATNVTYVTISTADGTVSTSTMQLDFDPATMAAGTFDIESHEAGSPALNTTKLKDISRFTNADGRMILDNTQTLTVYGNNGQAEVTMEGEDTLQDFMDKFNAALNELGMDGDVQYVGNTPATSGDYAMPGSLVFRSNSLVGAQSEIKLVGDESLVNALSVATIQQSEGADVTVSVTDAHTGAVIGSDTVSDYRLRGIIGGIDVNIDSSIKDGDSAYLHVVNKATAVQVGANEGQVFDVTVGEMSTRSLEIDDAYVMTMEDAQKAITKFDQALTKVTGARATIGAQINRLEYTMKNLSISNMNLTAAESRIRDLDVAEEAAAFASNQILVNAANAMLAQANGLPQIALQLLG